MHVVPCAGDRCQHGRELLGKPPASDQPVMWVQTVIFTLGPPRNPLLGTRTRIGTRLPEGAASTSPRTDGGTPTSPAAMAMAAVAKRSMAGCAGAISCSVVACWGTLAARAGGAHVRGMGKRRCTALCYSYDMSGRAADAAAGRRSICEHYRHRARLAALTSKAGSAAAEAWVKVGQCGCACAA